MKLMVVDDSNVMRRKITRAVAKVGINDVIGAENGVEALNLFRAEKPGFVTMDITMPEMDGVECIKQLMKEDPNVLILVVSAVSNKTTTMEALNNGARGFIQKPFDDDKLNDAIRQILADAV
jgi:two-component system chemotaxis response regulator CheY